MIIDLRGWIHGVSQTVDRSIKAVIIALLLIILGAITMQVFCRYFLKIPISLLQWLIQLSISWMSFLGAAVVLRRNEHFCIEILGKWLKNRYVRKVHRKLVASIEGLSILILIYTGWGFALLGAAKKSPATGYLMVYTYACIIVSAVFMLLFVIEHIFANPRQEEKS